MAEYLADVPPSTGHRCPQCDPYREEEPIDFGEEVVLLEAIEICKTDRGAGAQTLLDDFGDFLFTPAFLHIGCWDDAYGALRERLDEVPPRPDAASIIACAACGSGVRAGEYCLRWTTGELRVSPRRPSGEAAAAFAAAQRPKYMCFHCARLLHELDDGLELWEPCAQYGECPGCTEERCWRASGCSCACHDQNTEDE